MSAKSNLNSQAIAELRAALAEDPNRPDLQVVLANLYTLTGQNLAAIETCNAILNKLPYCLEANRILAEILPGTERAKEAQNYRIRYEELDPYAAQISAATPSAEQVSDGAITLERLIYSVTDELSIDTSKPGWAASLGVSMETENEIPDWLSRVPEEQTNPEPEKPEEPQPAAEKNGEGRSEPVPAEASGEGEIPAWLKEIHEEVEPDLPEVESAGPLPDWLNRSDTPEGGPIEEPTDRFEEEPPTESVDEMTFDTNLQIEASGKSEGEGAMVLDEDVEGGSVGQGADVEGPVDSPKSSEVVPGSAQEEPSPDWLAAAASSEPLEEGEQVPDWLQNLGEGLPSEPPDQEEDLLSDTAPAEEEPIPASEPAQQGSHADARIETPGSLPEWLAEASSEPEARYPDILPAGEGGAESLEEPEIARADVPDWLRQMEEEYLSGMNESLEESAETSALQYMPGEKPATGGDIPPWLVAAMESEETAISLGPIEEQLIEGDTQPVRITPQEEAEELPVEAETLPGEPSQVGLVERAEESLPSMLEESELEELKELSPELPAISEADESAAMAWLESLAARQGALEEELLTEPTERMEEMPEWVQMESVGEGTPEAEGAEGPGVGAPAFEKELEETAPEQAIAEPAEELPSEEGFQPPEWLVEPEEEIETIPAISEEPSEWLPEEAEVVGEEQAAEVIPEPEVELPAWLRDLGREEEGIETTPSWIRPESEAEAAAEEQPELLTTKLDINAASLIQLERIPGIGFILAQNIVNYRETIGHFGSLDELGQVPGFSPDAVQDLEEYLTIEIVTEAPPPPSTVPELQAAWNTVASGNITAAAEIYDELIRKEQYLDDIIRDLQEAIALHPVDAALYQALGDACVRANRLQDALDAYNRAEDLLK
jgi:competence ComEA-like helix-hairpin-helix protein